MTIDDPDVFVVLHYLNNMHCNTAMARLCAAGQMDPFDGCFPAINYDNADTIHPIYLVSVKTETVVVMVKAMDQLVLRFHILYHLLCSLLTLL